MSGERREERSRRAALAALAAVGALVAAAALATAVRLGSFALADPRLAQWDMAKYALDGVRVAQAIGAGRPLEALAWINRMDGWPPLFPLIEAPVFLAAGPSDGVAKGLLAALFAATALAALWAGASAGGRAGALAGGLAAALFLASPMARLFGTLVMLEVPGTLGLFAAAATYSRALSTGRERDFRLACLAATLLFFLKYNYGLLWLAPFLAHEAWRAAGSLAGLGRRARALVARVDLRSPWHLFLLAAGGLIAVIAVSGGFTLRLAGRELTADSVGAPLYALYLLVLLRAALSPRRTAGRWRSWWGAASPRERALLAWIAVPVALWLLVPAHTRELFHFLRNRSSGLPLLALSTHRAYLSAWLADFSPAPWVGWAVAACGLVAVIRLPRMAAPRRVVPLALAVALAATLLHPYKQERFLFTAAALLWLAAAALAGELAEAAARRLQPAAARLLFAALGWAAVGAAALYPVDTARLEREREWLSAPAAERPVVDAAAEACAAPPGCVLVGTWNDLSPVLVEWRLRQRHGHLPPECLPQDAARLEPGDAARLLDRLARLPPGARVVVFDLDPGGTLWSPGFGAETAWLDPARRALASSQSFVLEGTTTFPPTGYRLTVYRRAG